MISKKVVGYTCGFVIVAALSGGVTLALTQYFSSTTSDAVSGEVSGAPTPRCVSEGSEDFECYEIFYADLVEKFGVAAAFVDLKERYASTTAVQNSCHQITHAIGHAGADLEGGVGEAFAVGDPMCWSGYYHGVMETIIEGIGEEAIPQKLNDICAAIPGKDTYSFAYYNCVHGIGHGLMLIYDDDLFVSLDACTKLDGDWEQSSCSGGAFMENIMIEERGGVSEYLKKDDPIYPCNAVPERHRQDCYLMQTSHMLAAFEEDFSKVFAACDSVEDKYRATCYQSLGRDASGRSVSDAERTKATCMLGRDAFAEENCVIGAVKDFISYFHSDVEAKHFCTLLRSDLSAVCYDIAEEYYQTF